MSNTMDIYRLAQKVEVGVNHFQWVDIATYTYLEQLKEYAKKIKDKNPKAILSARHIVESEVDIGI